MYISKSELAYCVFIKIRNILIVCINQNQNCTVSVYISELEIFLLCMPIRNRSVDIFLMSLKYIFIEFARNVVKNTE